MGKVSTLAAAAAVALLGGCGSGKVVSPSGTPGELELLSVPPGARALVEQIRSGEEIPVAVVPATPDTLRGLEEGSYLLHFYLPGYASLDTVVAVEAGKMKAVTATLQAEVQKDTGTRE